jgi:hypothetical protein
MLVGMVEWPLSNRVIVMEETGDLILKNLPHVIMDVGTHRSTK